MKMHRNITLLILSLALVVVLLGAGIIVRPVSLEAPSRSVGRASYDSASASLDVPLVESLRREERKASLQRHDANGQAFDTTRWHLVNREAHIRAYVDAHGMEFHPREAERASWRIRMELDAETPNELRAEGESVVLDRGRVEERLENRADGLEHTFLVKDGPEAPFRLTLAVNTADLAQVRHLDSHGVRFIGRNGMTVDYRNLHVIDATGRELASAMRWEPMDADGRQGRIHLEIRETGRYPILVDPHASANMADPSWIKMTQSWKGSGAKGDRYGFSVASAGDVNGDGFSDIVVGSPFYDGGQVDEGCVFLYLGSPQGLEQNPAWKMEGNSPGARFGHSVAGAGDVNGDGYGDVVVGAPYYGGKGRVFLYKGRERTGYSDNTFLSLVWAAEIDQGGAEFGWAVSTAGDINGDGYSDILIGAPNALTASVTVPGPRHKETYRFYDGFLFAFSGRYLNSHGSSNPFVASSSGSQDGVWRIKGAGHLRRSGHAVAAAGDVNRDGYADVLITMHGPSLHPSIGGRVDILLGGSDGLVETRKTTLTGKLGFGQSISTAGDVDGDGYCDILIGSPQENRAYLYRGSDKGIDPTPTVVLYQPNSYDFGSSVALAGDVNGDGYSDVVVGAPGAVELAKKNAGRYFIYLGGSQGLSSHSAWESNAYPDVQQDARFASSVAGAGDVNGDGFSDIVVTAPSHEMEAGRAYVLYGLSLQSPPVVPEQRRWNDQAPMALGERSGSPRAVVLLAKARTSMGRTRARMIAQVEKTSIPYWASAGSIGDNRLVKHPYAETGWPNKVLVVVPGTLSSNTAYHWRVRFQYFPYLDYGPWLHLAPDDANAVHFRTDSLPPQPQVSLSSSSLSEGDAIELAMDPKDPDSSSVRIKVDWGDGSQDDLGSVPSAPYKKNHLYKDDGTFTIKVMVSDEQSSVARELSVSVRNRAPIVALNGPSVINEGGSFVAQGSFVDPGVDTWTARVDYGDGAAVQNVNLNANKTFSLSRLYSQEGTYLIRVWVKDDRGEGMASASLTVKNVAPAAKADALSTQEDKNLVFSPQQLLANDGDPGADTLEVRIVTGSGPKHGTLTKNPDGSYTYAPTLNFYGTDAFQYQAFDGTDLSSPATVTITVIPVNDAPVARPDSIETKEDIAVSFDPRKNDEDVDGDSLSIISVTGAAHGSVTYTAAQVTYKPNQDYFGSDAFQYTISDGKGGTETAQVSVKIDPVDDPPVAEAVNVETKEDLAVGVVLKGSDVDSAGLSYVIRTQPEKGTLSGAGPNLLYTPNPDATGDDSFLYRVQADGKFSSDAAVHIKILPVNDAPKISNLAATNGKEGQAVTLSARLHDPDHAHLKIRIAWGDGTVEGWSPVSVGDFTRTHVYTDNNDAYAITVELSDGALQDSQTLKVRVDNIAPIVQAGPDRTLTQGQTLQAQGSFSDPGSDQFTATVDYGTGLGPQPLSLNANKSFSLQHAYTKTGKYLVVVKVADDDDGAGSGAFTVTVENAAPTAGTDSYGCNEDSPLTIPAPGVLANDSDPGGDSLSALLTMPAEHGSVLLAGDGSFVYSPVLNFHGTDTFRYRASDGKDVSAEAVVTITVKPLNDPPHAADDAVVTEEDVSLVIHWSQLFDNDQDPDSPKTGWKISAIANAQNGSTVLDGPAKTITFAPNDNFHGSAKFQYTLEDGEGLSSQAWVTITVKPVNDPPTIAGTPATVVLEEQAYSFQAAAQDVDGDELVFSIEGEPAWAIFDSKKGLLSGTPSVHHAGKTYGPIVVSVSDGEKSASLAPFSIQVIDKTPPPTPAGLSAQSDGGLLVSAKIAIVWEAVADAGSGLDRYEIERSDGTAWVKLGSSGSASLVDQPMAAGPYRYRVRAVDKSGNASPYSAPSDEVTLFANHSPLAPRDLGQYRADGKTALIPGATLRESAIVLRARLSDPDGGQRIQLQIEIKPQGVDFDGQDLRTSRSVQNDEVAEVVVTGLATLSYRWRARALDDYGVASDWAPGLEVTIQPPKDFAPRAPVLLGQYRSDGKTAIAVGEIRIESTFVVRAVVSDPDRDYVRLLAELTEMKTGFKKVYQSAFVPSGSEAQIVLLDLSDAAYRWRAWAEDPSGLVSEMVSLEAKAAHLLVDTAPTVAPNKPTQPATLLAFSSDGRMAFRAFVSDADGADQTLRLAVEVRPADVAFRGIASAYGPRVAGDMETQVEVSGLPDGTYRWQVWTTDSSGRASEWVAAEETFQVARANAAPSQAAEVQLLHSDATTALAQENQDILTFEPQVVIAAKASDPEGHAWRVQVEIRSIDIEFANHATAESTLAPSGQISLLRLDGFQDGVYRWQVRAIDELNRPSPWYQPAGNLIVDRKANQSPMILELRQYRTDGQTEIPSGGATLENEIVLAASIDAGDTGQIVRMRVEVKPADIPFDGTINATGDWSATGSKASISLGGLKTGVSYHWRAWAEDTNGAESEALSSEFTALAPSSPPQTGGEGGGGSCGSVGVDLLWLVGIPWLARRRRRPAR